MKRQLFSVLLIALLAVSFGAPLALAQSEQPSEPGLVIVQVDADGPAAKAGVRRGDILLALNGQQINQPGDWFRALRGLAAGEALELQVLHGDDQRTLTATVDQRNSRAFLGLQVYLGGAQDTAQDEPLTLPAAPAGAAIVEVVEDSPASAAGLQPGDVITAVDGTALDAETSLADLIGDHKPGDQVTLTVARAGSDDEGQELTVVLGKNPDDATRPFLGVRYTSTMDMPDMQGQIMPFFGQPGGEMPFGQPGGEMPFGQPGGEATPGSRALSGALVRVVTEEGPAAEAGLQMGDVITAVDGDAVDGAQGLVDALAGRKPGDSVLLTVARADRDEGVEIEATLGQHPDDAERAYLGVSVSDVTLRPRGLRHGQGSFRLPFDLDQLPFDLNQLPFDLDQLPFDLPFELPSQQQPAGPQA